MKTSLAIVTALVLSACQSTKDIPATCDELKGTCGDGWTLAVAATTPATYAVAVTFASATTTLSCVVPGGPCMGGDDRVHGTVDTNGITIGTLRSPSTVVVVVTRGTEAPLMQTFSPKYGATYPNGTDCAPVCAVADDSLVVPLSGIEARAFVSV
jgi:hypothetical protein